MVNSSKGSWTWASKKKPIYIKEVGQATLLTLLSIATHRLRDTILSLISLVSMEMLATYDSIMDDH